MFEHLTPKVKESAERLNALLDERRTTCIVDNVALAISISNEARRLLSALGETPWRPIRCTKCDGTGQRADLDEKGDNFDCAYCKGKGTLGETPWRPTPKIQGYAWSDNEEDYYGDENDSIESALEAAKKGTDAEHVWIGEVETPDFANLCGDWCSTHLVGSVMECFDTDFGGDWWESDMLTMEKEAIKTLAPYIERAVNEWMTAHGGLTSYNVVHAKLYPLPNPPTEAPL